LPGFSPEPKNCVQAYRRGTGSIQNADPIPPELYSDIQPFEKQGQRFCQGSGHHGPGSEKPFTKIQMIAKAKSISHGARGIDYALKKEGAEIIDKRFVIGENGTEIKSEFKIFQDLNTRATNKDLSFVLSPEPKDGRNLTNAEFREIGEDFLKRMKLDQHQAIIVKHKDRDHTHLHIFANRIDTNGKAFKDSFISKDSQRAADKIAKERGLTRAKVVEDYNKEMTKELRGQIFEKHKAILQHRPRDFQAYKDLMQSSGVKVVPTINKAKKLQGFKLEYQGQSFKASEVNRSMTLSKMGVEKTFSGQNPELKTTRKRDRGFGLER
jgi:hypothetical protein